MSPRTWPFSLDWLPDTAYLVGGSVRDALLGRRSEYLDLDFVLPADVVETAQAIARHYKAGYVLLDAERQIARLVFPQGTVDFAQQVGTTLETDLQRRDFTVNAIAYSPHTNQLVDPLEGYADLQQRQIRMISPENLSDDPLRLLRAYRQAAQLGFSLEATTQASIQQMAPLLRRIAAERVQSELNYLLSSRKGTPWLRTAWQDGLLQDWLPYATEQSLDQIAAIDQAIAYFRERLPEFATELTRDMREAKESTDCTRAGKPTEQYRSHQSRKPFTGDPIASSTTRNWLMLARLASLLPAAPTTEIEAHLRQLKYSRNEVQGISTALKCLPQLLGSAGSSKAQPGQLDLPLSLVERSRRDQCQFFQAVGITFPMVAVLVIARGEPLGAIVPLIDRFLDPGDPVAHPSPLVTGRDLMTALQLPPGPNIGYLLDELQLSRAEGKIATKADALDLAAALVQQELC